MLRIILLVTASILKLSIVFCQTNDKRKIVFPDVPGYKTLKCDFHIHTVFSDGLVWPTIRIDEALKDGLDAISLTEHIEYQPWKKDIPHPDRNRSYELAKEYAKPHDLLIVHGTEITRSMPPGHANAIFVKDVNKIKQDSAIDSYREAVKQGAFIFWNHPNWVAQRKDALVLLTDFHKMLIKEKMLHGIEVVNDLTYSEEALKLADEQNLTVMGTSDIHGLIDYNFKLDMGGHRPITLIFAKEKTEDAIRDALFAGRTVTWFENLLVGKEENISLLLNSTLTYENKGFLGNSEVKEILLKNNSSAKLVLKNVSPYTFYNLGDLIILEPNSSVLLQVKSTLADNKLQPLTFEVQNAVCGYRKVAKYSVKF